MDLPSNIGFVSQIAPPAAPAPAAATAAPLFRCSGPCRQSLPLADFDRGNRGPERRQPCCRTCHRAMKREHYLNNVDYYVKKASRHRVAAYPEIVAKVSAMIPVDCARCSLPIPGMRARRLHQGRAATTPSPRTLAQNGYSVNSIARDIEASEFVCGRCYNQARREAAGSSKAIV